MFAIPSLKDSVERARTAFRSYLPGSDAWIWPNNINPTAKVFGGIEHLLFGFADYVQKQKFALTADSENLDLHGEELGLARRPAAPAAGAVVITTPDALAVKAGAVLTRSDGAQYLATAGGAIGAAGILRVSVIAAADGKASNAVANTPLDLTSGFSGPGLDDATASVDDSGIAGGLDVEDDETFRARILFRKRNPPHGGSAADYVMWASSVTGVTRVFVERLFNGPGTVRVFPLMDDLYPDGIPQPADIARVVAHLNTVQPAGALVTVAAPVAVPVTIAIGGLQPFTTDVQEAIRVELAVAFRLNSRVAGSDAAISTMPYLASPTSFSRSWIWQAIANAFDEARSRVDVPVADVGLLPGQIATLGGVIFSSN
ncbi:baseplate J/gp47 family protein [Bradyrhizobium sp. SZCCHNR3003]|uniref:baseplate J/gp47 family protein n=1 Tax=Bradyrhizobium sp. SZCCHNR3003 TaxID=3057387 RepID=UPI00291706EB|nr:baseplate J/gp47 family protein [Bradyrhizobium sp. SZCCHNR3003]